MPAQTVAKLIGVAILIFVIVIALSTSSYVVQPGTRGVEVTLGKVSPVFKPEGFGFKTPFITSIARVTIRQQTREVNADCYSSDLQQVKMNLRVLYKIPEASVVQIYQGFAGDPFDSEAGLLLALAELGASDPSYHEVLFRKRDELSRESRALLALVSWLTA